MNTEPVTRAIVLRLYLNRAVPSPVPLNELRILKRGSEKRACVMYRFTEVNNSEDVDAA